MERAPERPPETTPERRALGALVVDARSGDSRAWDDLVERFLPLVCATIGRLGLHGAEAEDVNQTVWLRLVEHLDAVREPDALPGWIATTARRECLRTFDRGRRMVPVDPQVSTRLEVTADVVGVDDDLLRDEQQRALRAALDELPEDRRRLLLLLLEDPPLPYREVSERLGIPVGSIGPTRARALEQLRNSSALRAFGATSPLQEGPGR